MLKKACVILGAGRSSRMGQHKLLLPWGIKTVLEHVIQTAQASACFDTICLVTGYQQTVLQPIAEAYGICTCHNAEYQDGEILSSVQVALHHLGDRYQGALIFPADMPRIDSDVIQEIMAMRQTGVNVAPVYNNQRGHPVWIDCAFWDEILHLPSGGRTAQILQKYPDQLLLLPSAHDGVIADLDTPEDYAREWERYQNEC